MVPRHSKIIESLTEVARTLGTLNEEVVYVGGAVAGLYADDPAAEEARPTMDVDIVVRISSNLELERFREALAARGIFPETGSAVICRFRCGEILLDVMATEPVDWAPSSRWFKAGFATREQIIVAENIRISILAAPFYLASKFEALHDRGDDLRLSADLEDIIYILNNRPGLSGEVRRAPAEVRSAVQHELKILIESPDFEEAVSAHLMPGAQRGRLPIIHDRIKAVMDQR